MFIPFEIGLTMGLIFALAVMALGIAFRLLHFPDLTIEGSVPLGAAIYATLVTSQSTFLSSWPCLLILPFAAGALSGALTAFLHTRFRMNKFLAGIIVVAISYSLSLRIMGASNIGLLNAWSIFDLVNPLNSIGAGAQVWTILVLILIVIFWTVAYSMFLNSRLGLKLRVSGSNADYAKALGINVPVNIIVGLALTNGLAAMSGVLLASYQGFADVGLGQGFLILSLAALTIGERVVPTARFSFPVFIVLATVFGSVLYQVIVAYAVRLGLAPTDLKMATAILVLIIVALRISKEDDLLSGEV